jgi:chorismate--pyruvate lyase
MFRRSKPSPIALREAPWVPLPLGRLPGIDPQMQDWLSDGGSLTRSVIASCRGRFAVDLVRQQRAAALPSEARMLGQGAPQATLVREVRLRCGRKVWVYARTLIPLTSLRGPAQALTRLGRRPLGEVLFSDPRTRRLRVDVARLTARHRLFARATAHLDHKPAEIWGRRTLFDYGGEQILVNELFMPRIPVLVR